MAQNRYLRLAKLTYELKAIEDCEWLLRDTERLLVILGKDITKEQKKQLLETKEYLLDIINQENK